VESSPSFQSAEPKAREQAFALWQKDFVDTAIEDPDNFSLEGWQQFKEKSKKKMRELRGGNGLMAANAEADDEVASASTDRLQLVARKRELETKAATLLGGLDTTFLAPEERDELQQLKGTIAEADEDDLDAVEEVANDDREFYVANGQFYASPSLALAKSKYRDAVKNAPLTAEQKVEALMKGKSLREEVGSRLRGELKAVDEAFADSTLFGQDYLPAIGGTDKFNEFEKDYREVEPDATDADVMEKWQEANGAWYSNLGTQLKLGALRGASNTVGAYYGIKRLLGAEDDTTVARAEAAGTLSQDLSSAIKATGGATLAADASSMVYESLVTAPAGLGGRGIVAAGRGIGGLASRTAAAATAGRIGAGAFAKAAALKAGGEAAAKILARQAAISKTGGLAAASFAAGLQSAGGSFNQYFDEFLKDELASIPEAERTPEVVEEARRRARDGARARAIVSGLVTATITAGFGATGAEKLAAPQVSKAAEAAKAGMFAFLAKSLSKEALSEASEEGLDEFVNGVIDKVAVDPSKPVAEIIKDSLKAAVAGGLLGAGMSAPYAIADAYEARREAKNNPVVQERLKEADSLEAAGATISAGVIRQKAAEEIQADLNRKAEEADAAAAAALNQQPAYEQATVVARSIKDQLDALPPEDPARVELQQRYDGLQAAISANPDAMVRVAEPEVATPVAPATAAPAPAPAPATTAAPAPVAVTPASAPSPNLLPRATESAPPKPVYAARPAGETRAEFNARRDEWENKYEKTHNYDGTPYQPTVLDETVANAIAALKDKSFDDRIDAVGTDINSELGSYLTQLLNDGWVWDANTNRMVDPQNRGETPAAALARISRGEAPTAPAPTQESPAAPPAEPTDATEGPQPTPGGVGSPVAPTSLPPGATDPPMRSLGRNSVVRAHVYRREGNITITGDAFFEDGEWKYPSLTENTGRQLNLAEKFITSVTTAAPPAPPVAQQAAAETPAPTRPAATTTKVGAKPTVMSGPAMTGGVRVTPVPPAEPTDAGSQVGRSGTEEQLSLADLHAQNVGGTVMYQVGDVALIRGYSTITGEPVYSVANKDVRSTFDIESERFKNDLVTPEQKAELVSIKARLESESQKAFEEAPHIKFDDGVAFSKGIPSSIAGVVKSWRSLLGLKSNLYVTTFEDAVAEKDSFNGPHRVIGSAGLSSSAVDGSIRKMPNGDYYIMFRVIPGKIKMLEVLAHELGHLHQYEVFVGADAETQQMLIDEHAKWLESNKDKTAQQLINSLRANRTARSNVGTTDGLSAAELNLYWKSFGEWYADQVSRWAVSSAKPLTLVEKYFSRIAKALRNFYEKVVNQGYLPNETFVEYLERTLANPERTFVPTGAEESSTEQLSQRLAPLATPRKAKPAPTQTDDTETKEPSTGSVPPVAGQPPVQPAEGQTETGAPPRARKGKAPAKQKVDELVERLRAENTSEPTVAELQERVKAAIAAGMIKTGVMPTIKDVNARLTGSGLPGYSNGSTALNNFMESLANQWGATYPPEKGTPAGFFFGSTEGGDMKEVTPDMDDRAINNKGGRVPYKKVGGKVVGFFSNNPIITAKQINAGLEITIPKDIIDKRISPGITYDTATRKVTGAFDLTRGETKVTAKGGWTELYSSSPSKIAKAEATLKESEDDANIDLDELREELRMINTLIGRADNDGVRSGLEAERNDLIDKIAELTMKRNPLIPSVALADYYLKENAPVEQEGEGEVLASYLQLNARGKPGSSLVENTVQKQLSENWPSMAGGQMVPLIEGAVVNMALAKVRREIESNPDASPEDILKLLPNVNVLVNDVIKKFAPKSRTWGTVISGSIDEEPDTADLLTAGLAKEKSSKAGKVLAERVSVKESVAAPLTEGELELLRQDLEKMDGGDPDNANFNLLKDRPLRARQFFAATEKNLLFKIGVEGELVFEYGPELESNEADELADLLIGIVPPDSTDLFDSLSARPNVARFFISMVKLGRDALKDVKSEVGAPKFSSKAIKKMNVVDVFKAVAKDNESAAGRILEQAKSNVAQYSDSADISVKEAKEILKVLMKGPVKPVEVRGAPATPPATKDQLTEERVAGLDTVANSAKTIIDTVKRNLDQLTEKERILTDKATELLTAQETEKALEKPNQKKLAEIQKELNMVNGELSRNQEAIREAATSLKDAETVRAQAASAYALEAGKTSPPSPEVIASQKAKVDAALKAGEKKANDQRNKLLNPAPTKAVGYGLAATPETPTPRNTVEERAEFKNQLIALGLDTSPDIDGVIRALNLLATRVGTGSPHFKALALMFTQKGSLLNGVNGVEIVDNSNLAADVSVIDGVLTFNVDAMTDTLDGTPRGPEALLRGLITHAATSLTAPDAVLNASQREALTELETLRADAIAMEQSTRAAGLKPRFTYALKDTTSFVNAMLMSPEFAEMLQTFKMSRKAPSLKSAWGRFWAAMGKLLTGKPVASGSALHAGLMAAGKLMVNSPNAGKKFLDSLMTVLDNPEIAFPKTRTADAKEVTHRVNVDDAVEVADSEDNIDTVEDRLLGDDSENADPKNVNAANDALMPPGSMLGSAPPTEPARVKKVPRSRKKAVEPPAEPSPESEAPLPEPAEEDEVPFAEPAEEEDDVPFAEPYVEVTTEDGSKKPLDFNSFLRAASVKTGRRVAMVDAGPGVPEQPLYVRHDRTDTTIYMNKSAMTALVEKLRAAGYSTKDITARINTILDREASTLAILQRFSDGELIATARSLDYKQQRKLIKRVYDLNSGDAGFMDYLSRGKSGASQDVTADMIQMGADYYRMMRQVAETGHTTEDVLDMLSSSPGTFTRTSAFLKAYANQFMTWWRAYGDVAATRAIINIDEFLNAVTPMAPNAPSVLAAPSKKVPQHEAVKIVANTTGRSINEVLDDVKMVKRIRKSMKQYVLGNDRPDTTVMTVAEAREFVTSIGLNNRDPKSVATALGRIADMGGVNPALRAIAGQLSKNPQIASLADFTFVTDATVKIDGELVPAAGLYSPAEHTLELEMPFMLDEFTAPDPDEESSWSQQYIIESLIHEAVHAVTSRTLFDYESGVALPPKIEAAVKGLEGLRAAVSGQEGADKFSYALSNIDEYIAAVSSDPNFVSWLAALPPSVGADVPGETGQTSVIQRILRRIYQIIFPNMEPDSALQKSLSRVFDLAEYPHLGANPTKTKLNKLYRAKLASTATRLKLGELPSVEEEVVREAETVVERAPLASPMLPGAVTGKRKKTEALKNSLPAMPEGVREYLKESTYLSETKAGNLDLIESLIGKSIAVATDAVDFAAIDSRIDGLGITESQRFLARVVLIGALNKRILDLEEAMAKTPTPGGLSLLSDYEGVSKDVGRKVQNIISGSAQVVSAGNVARDILNPKFVAATYRDTATGMAEKKLPTDAKELLPELQKEADDVAADVVKKSKLTKKIVEAMTKASGGDPTEVQMMFDFMTTLENYLDESTGVPIPAKMADWVADQMLKMVDSKLKAEVKKAADKIKKASTSGSDAEATFFEEYSDEVKRLVAERINQALAAKPTTPEMTAAQKDQAKKEALRAAIGDLRSFLEYAPSVERALNQSKAKLLARLEAEKGSTPEALKLYEDAKAAIGAMSVDFVPMKKATDIVRRSFDMREQVYLSITEQQANVTQLAAMITNATGLTADQSRKVAESFKAAYEAEMNRRVQKILTSYATRRSTVMERGKDDRYSRSERFLRLARLGGLRKEEFYNAMATEFDLPSYDPAIADELDREANRIMGMPKGSVQRNDAMQALNARIVNETYKNLLATYGPKALVKDSSMRAEYLAAIPVAMWKSAVLSGFGTAEVNFAFGTMQSIMDLGFNASAYAIKAKDPAFAASSLITLMRAVGWVADPAQRKEVWTEMKRAALTGRTRFGSEQSENMLVLERDIPAIDVPVIKQLMGSTKRFYKLMGRIGSVIDATVAVPASIARQRLALHYALTTSGADQRKIAEIMSKSFSLEEMESREINEILEAEKEQFRNSPRPDLAMQARRFQLMEQRRAETYEQLTANLSAKDKENFLEASRESARFANLGTTPTGLAGLIFDGVFGAIERKTKGVSSVVVSFPRAMGNLLDFSLAMSFPFLAYARAKNKSPSSWFFGEDNRYRREFVEKDSVKYWKLMTQNMVALTVQATLGALYWFGLEDEAEGRVPWFMVYGKGYVDSERNRQLRYRQPKWAPYTMKIGDLYLSWKDLPGFNLLLGGLAAITDDQMMKGLKDVEKIRGWEAAANTTVAFLKAVTVKSSLQGLAQAGEIMSDSSFAEASAADNIGKMVTGFVGGVTNPRFLRDVTNIGRGAVSGGEYTLKDTRGTAAAVLSMLPGNELYGEALGQRNMLNSMGTPVTNFWYAPLTKRLLPLTAGPTIDPIMSPLVSSGLFISPVKSGQMSFATYKTGSDEVDAKGGLLSSFRPEVEADAVKLFGEQMRLRLTPEYIKELTDLAEEGQAGREIAQKALNKVSESAREYAKGIIQNRIFDREIVPHWQEK
jgi:hypothetical protein